MEVRPNTADSRGNHVGRILLPVVKAVGNLAERQPRSVSPGAGVRSKVLLERAIDRAIIEHVAAAGLELQVVGVAGERGKGVRVPVFEVRARAGGWDGGG